MWDPSKHVALRQILQIDSFFDQLLYLLADTEWLFRVSVVKTCGKCHMFSVRLYIAESQSPLTD